MIHIVKRDKIIKIDGHADYQDTNDIVCASVSSIMYTTVNALLKYNDKSIKYEDDGDIVTIKILKTDKVINILIDNMMSLFKSLVTNYPDNVKIEEEE
ncbi:MAG TPA: ribosomal-processing cysteine protease Prp [Bacilli bacterium]|jgi:uncharacterized protein YsxB (DUF464 family)|nr:ribosomal-processing cysteine protease Prp [Bacilli bacterium]HPZ23637.1 ribosomal-processing cysteine protease Prp [Bacilli bacterium]HQC83618.1 ribosomal-processing cysteine protease Prp [Bacilli bacterium]